MRANIRDCTMRFDLLDDPFSHFVAVSIALVEGEFLACGITEIAKTTDQQRPRLILRVNIERLTRWSCLVRGANLFYKRSLLMIRRPYINRKLADWMETKLSVPPSAIKHTVPDINARLCLRDLIIDLSETARLSLCDSPNIIIVAHSEALQPHR